MNTTETRLAKAVRNFLKFEQTDAAEAEVIAAAKRLHRQSRRNRLYVGLCNAEPETVADAISFAGAYNAHLLEGEESMERDCSDPWFYKGQGWVQSGQGREVNRHDSAAIAAVEAL